MDHFWEGYMLYVKSDCRREVGEKKQRKGEGGWMYEGKRVKSVDCERDKERKGEQNSANGPAVVLLLYACMFCACVCVQWRSRCKLWAKSMFGHVYLQLRS